MRNQRHGIADSWQRRVSGGGASDLATVAGDHLISRPRNSFTKYTAGKERRRGQTQPTKPKSTKLTPGVIIKICN
jgi:hypothetical protein